MNIRAFAILSSISLLLSGCTADPTLPFKQAAVQRAYDGVGSAADSEMINVSVWFATNRRQEAKASLPYFSGKLADGAEPKDRLKFDQIEIQVPRLLPIGGGGAEDWTRGYWNATASDRQLEWQVKVSPTNKIEGKSADDWIKLLDKKKDWLIYVHGFNNNFADAVITAGQLAHDLGGQVVPIVFSWPAEGGGVSGIPHYPSDDNDAGVSRADLNHFLEQLLKKRKEMKGKTGDEQLTGKCFLVSHSMGTRLVTRTLSHLATGNDIDTLDQLVMGGGDMDQTEFAQWLPEMKKRVTAPPRVTVYVSDRDFPLRSSETFHGNDRPRLGQGGSKLRGYAGVDVVDVSLVDYSALSHSYMANCRPVIADLFLGLVHGKPANERNLYKILKIGGKDVQADGGNVYLIRP